MSTIRRQSIISSFIVYFGFALGFVNTYLFTQGSADGSGFTETQYGLTGLFIAIANIMFALAHLGSLQYVHKYFPYYADNLEPKKNDQFTWALTISISGFIMVMLGGYVFKDLVVQKYATNSPELVTYFYWIFPFGFGLTVYSLVEAFAWQFNETVLTNFLREVLFRLLTTLLILFTFAGILTSFDVFIKIFAFTYIIIAAILTVYLFATKKVHLTFSVSRVTKKFSKKIIQLMLLLWGGGLVFNISQVFDSLVIAAVMPNGLAMAGIYTLAQNMSSLIQAPQRAIISASLGPLSRSWKDKDFDRIKRIYSRSSINQLIFAVGMFVLIWINFTDGVLTFGLRSSYLDARPAFLFIGLMRVLDLGTGLNGQIIGTSTYWRFEFITGVILLALALPLNYLLTREYGIVGTAASNLVALAIYNSIRFTFLYRKFGMQPFTSKTIYTLFLGAIAYLICHLLFKDKTGFVWIATRSALFAAIYLTGVLMLKLSPDLRPVLQNVGKRFTRNGK
jgi:O-antigen/teichoic acid export membrane protein